MVFETQISMSFPTSQFVIQGFAPSFRLDRTITGGVIIVCIQDDTPPKLQNISYVSSDTECLAIEVNLHKAKWLLTCLCNLQKSNISNHLMNLSKIIDWNSSWHDKYLCIGDVNSETSETALKHFSNLYKLKDLDREPTCFKNSDKPSCIGLLLTNRFNTFSRYTVNWNFSFRFSQNESNSLLEDYFTKQKHEIIFYRNYKKIDNLKF